MKTGWWKITYTIDPDDVDLEYIAEEIKKGFTEGEIHHEDDVEDDVKERS